MSPAPDRSNRDTRRTAPTPPCDPARGGRLQAIEFSRIKGGKPFNTAAPWFSELLADIGQPRGATVTVRH
jgi:hypothetical protein